MEKASPEFLRTLQDKHLELSEMGSRTRDKGVNTAASTQDAWHERGEAKTGAGTSGGSDVTTAAWP